MDFHGSLTFCHGFPNWMFRIPWFDAATGEDALLRFASCYALNKGLGTPRALASAWGVPGARLQRLTMVTDVTVIMEIMGI